MIIEIYPLVLILQYMAMIRLAALIHLAVDQHCTLFLSKSLFQVVIHIANINLESIHFIRNFSNGSIENC